MRVKFIVFDGEIVALFPDEDYDHSSSCIVCYSHVGQHSGASRDLIRHKMATREQYEPLLKELKSIGYDDLEVINWDKKKKRKK